MRKRHLFMLCLILFLASATQGAFQFVAWADNRPYDAANEARFIWMLEQMNQLVGSEPAFHVIPGDYDYTSITDSDVQEYSLIKASYKAPGNHDGGDFSMSHYVLDYPPESPEARLIFLNEYICPSDVDETVEPHDCSAGRICYHTLTWLESQLADGSAPPVLFVIGHEPAFPLNRHVGDSLDAFPTDRDNFWNLLGQYGATYICGHTHYYSTYSSGGASQIDLGNAGNPGEPHQTFVVFSVADGSSSYTKYTTEYNVTAYPPATNPMPADQATGISTTPTPSWTAGSGASSHDVYFAKADAGLPSTPINMGQASCRIWELGYDDGLLYDTPYVWRVDEVFADGHITQGPVWTFRTKEKVAVRHAVGETTIDGSVLGDIDGTERRDDIYEELSEALNVPNKNGYGTLEHIWRFDNVPTGANLQFRIEAHRSAIDLSDLFGLSYSTDNSSYTPLLSVDKTLDDNSEDIVSLPPGINGTIWVKAKNTDHVKGSGTLDTLYVDCMYFVSSDETIADLVVPSESGNQAPIADAGPDQVVIDAEEDGETVTFDGSGSSDPDGSSISYRWTTGTVTLYGVNPTHDFAIGEYVVTLTVTDAENASTTDQVTIKVQSPTANQSPIANAGPDQIVIDAEGDGETVTLDGSGSSDSDGSIVLYRWTTGTVTLDGANPTHDFAIGEYVATLTVTDDDGASASDTVTITVQAAGGTMHVDSFSGTVNARGASGQWAALVTVMVVDEAGKAVFGANVTGAWSGAASGTSSGITGSDGKVTLSSENMKSGTSATFTVTDVTHSTLKYDDTANSATSYTVNSVK